LRRYNLSWFDWTRSSSNKSELPEIFPIPILQKDFVKIDTENIFKRILVDVIERTQGIPEVAQNLVWDNCLASEKQDGLITLLAKAMVAQHDLFLIYKPALKVIRRADQIEEQRIRQDYAARGESDVGVFITFKNYDLSQIIQFYSLL